MSNFELLAHAAQCKGSAGVHEYLQEHRLVAPDFLQELSTPILLGVEDKDEDATAADFGICMEKLNLRVQRDIWSALASGASPCADTAVSLARAFLRVTAIPRRREIDNVCLLLAKMVLQEDADDQKRESNPVDNAFRRRMRRSTMNRVEFSLQNENHGKLVTSSRLYTTRLAASRSKKRVRADVVLDQILVQKTEQRLRDQSLSCIPTPEPPLISKKMEDRASNLAKRLDHLSYSESTTVADDIASCVFTLLAEIVNDVRTTYVANERSFQYLCTVLRIDSANDEVLYQITRALVDSNWSSRYAAIFIKTSVLPKVRSADSVISRVLLRTAFYFGSRYAEALVGSLLLPLLVGGNDDNLRYIVGTPQAEAITRILNNSDAVSADRLDEFVSRSLEAAATNEHANPMCPHLLSNESALLVYQTILSTQPALSPLTVERFIGACEAVLERPGNGQVRGSLKFATVIFTLISKYPEHCARHVESLEAIVTQLTSIMMKTTLRCLQKLKP